MRFLAVGLLVTLITGNILAQEKLQVLDTSGKSTSGDPVSNVLGFQFGSSLAQDGIELGDLKQEDLVKGLMDALAGKDPGVSNEAVDVAMRAFQQKLQGRAADKAKVKLAEGQKFLEENKKKEGVQVTSTGLQYKVIKNTDNKDAPSPKATSQVSVHYEGKLLNGEVFDSSVRRGQPATFPLNQVIPGWTEGLQRMKVGDKWQFFIPSNLAYGENGRPPVIGPNEVLTFEVELLEVK